jgi:hypothetical protein
VCCILPAPDVVSAVKEVPIGVKGYDHGVDGSRAKDDWEVFGRRVRKLFHPYKVCIPTHLPFCGASYCYALLCQVLWSTAADDDS